MQQWSLEQLAELFTALRSYASAVLGVVILSVCLSVHLSVFYTRTLWQNQIIHCGYFDTRRKDNHSSFLTPTVDGARRPERGAHKNALAIILQCMSPHGLLWLYCCAVFSVSCVYIWCVFLLSLSLPFLCFAYFKSNALNINLLTAVVIVCTFCEL